MMLLKAFIFWFLLTQKLPTPRFAVFYNGKEERPEIEYMRLSDAFEHPADEPELELICTVYNINPGHNTGLLDQNDVLREYTLFVECVRRYTIEMDVEGTKSDEVLELALDKAIDECIKNGILRDFLKERRDEVKRTVMLDYTFERRLKLNQAESQETIDQLQTEIDQQAAEIDQQAAEIDQQKERIIQLEKLLADKGIDIK